MNTDRLFEFQVLAKTLHYGHAAEKLYMAQSVLSRHIQDMEKELGVQLFQRGAHGVSLTTAGVALYRASWDFLRTNEKALERVQSAGIGVAGSVRFACLRSVICRDIEDFLGYFCEKFPDVLLTADILDNHTLEEMMGYNFLAMPSSAIDIPDCFKLLATFHEKCWLALPRKHRLQSVGEVSVSELAGETLFLPGYPSPVGSYARIRQITEQATSGHIRIIRVPNPETALLNVNLGRGVTILPRHRLDELTRNVSHTSLKEDCGFEILVYLNKTAKDPPAQLFGDELLRLLSSMS